MKAGRRRIVVGAGALLGLAGCGLWRPVTVPMRQQAFPADPCADHPAPATPRPLLVLLPGRFMGTDEMVHEGMVATVRRHGLDVDVLLVDAHLGYYRDRSILDRLQADVIAPARSRGVRDIWLAGISLGGFGALLYAESHPGEIAGIVALAPYLGEPRIADEIRRAGGLRAWTPPPDLPPMHKAGAEGLQAEQRLWGWLKDQMPARPPSPVPPLFLGYGEDDRYAPMLQLLAATMPARRVAVRPGGHDWPAWRPLWDDLLGRLPLHR